MKKNYSLLFAGFLLATSTLVAPTTVNAAPTSLVEIQWMASDGTVAAAKPMSEQAPQQEQQQAQHPVTKKKSKAKTVWIVVGVGLALAILRAVIAAS